MLLLNIRIRYNVINKIDFIQCYTNGDDEFLTNPLASEIWRFLLKYQLLLQLLFHMHETLVNNI